MNAQHIDMPPLEFPALYLDREGWEGLHDKLKDPFFQHLHDDNCIALHSLLETEPRVNPRALKNYSFTFCVHQGRLHFWNSGAYKDVKNAT